MTAARNRGARTAAASAGAAVLLLAFALAVLAAPAGPPPSIDRNFLLRAAHDPGAMLPK